MQISTRREVLQATGLGTALAPAGCSGNYLSGSDTTTKLGRVEIVNRDTSAHTVHISIRRGDELVHDQPYNLSPDDPSNRESQNFHDLRWDRSQGENHYIELQKPSISKI